MIGILEKACAESNVSAKDVPRSGYLIGVRFFGGDLPEDRYGNFYKQRYG
jgi:hypothetical protein